MIELDQKLEGLLQRKVNILTDGGLSPYLEQRIHAEAVPYEGRPHLLHIRDAIQHIIEYTAAGKEDFFADRKTQSSRRRTTLARP